METIENNTLIAEFDQKYTEGFGLYDFNGCHYKLDELEFHKSWDWLMPIINKCYQEHMSKHIVEAVMTCDINEAYQAVVEFIKEYKEQNKVDETHQHLREILIKYNSPEYGDCIIDEICHLFDYPLTNDEN